MCGIAGIIYKSKVAKPLLEKEIKQMTDAVSHRGPDGEGFFIENNMALGHRRLSIIDLTEDGKQPMNWNDKYWITYNGEIYNYIEIKEELTAKGYHFSSHSDTEVILAAYDFWGENCVMHFNGMWAFAIYNTETNKLFCSRDRFGVKPFYYVNYNDRFLFGSEIKQILQFRKDIKPEYKTIVNYLVLNICDYNDETFFAGIKKLLGGHNLMYDLSSNTYEIKKYYHITYHSSINELQENEAVQYFKKEFQRSINYRLRSDVKVGTCLSGGLDSSGIAALASKEYTKTSAEKFSAITAESVEEATNEKKYAKQVVDHNHLNWHITTPGTTDFESVLKKVIEVQEYPFISPSVYMQYFVMKEAKQAGITVLLDGQGSDETLLGYARYTATQASQLGFFKYLFSLPKLKDKYALSYKTLLQYYFYMSVPFIRKFRQANAFKGLKTTYKKLRDFDFIEKYAAAQKDINKLQHLEIFETQIPQLLRYEDKNSMAHSIETRLPFLDWQLVETSLSLNNNFKIKDGWSKFILRKAVADELPESIVWRKNKIGFASPTDTWLKNIESSLEQKIYKSDILNELFDKFAFSKLPVNKKWRLYCIALWEEVVVKKYT